MTREITVTIDPGDTRVVRLYRDGDPVPATNGIPAGGTTGQVLAKASNTDRDVEWVNQGSGPGAVDWGDIGGTLSDQTDLQAALDAKQAASATLTTLSSATAAGLALMDDADAAAQRTTLGLGTAATTASTDYATAAQGALADTATQPADLASAISDHSAASDPHGDRAYADAALATKLDDLSAGTADAIVTASADGTLLSRAAYTIATLLAAARDRATHTGTQLAATISDFATAALAAVTWSTLTGKPSTFAPDAHDQGSDTITSTLLEISGTTHTAAAADDGKIYRLTHASGCTVTIPDSLSAGWSVGWEQAGNAQSTFAVSGSMVLRNRQSHTKSAGQWATGNLLIEAANSVVLSGDTST